MDYRSLYLGEQPIHLPAAEITHPLTGTDSANGLHGFVSSLAFNKGGLTLIPSAVFTATDYITVNQNREYRGVQARG